MPELQNAIRVNHRGFLAKGAKRFILTDNKTDSLAFSVVITHDVKDITVYEGEMTAVCEDGKTYYVGDFSSLTRNGDYYILAGGYRSRQFVIYDGAYDICKRIMLGYFTYQRCGHPLGWNGCCHTDDGFIKESGEHVDLSGGYHQSCDLRKSPGGVSIGVLSMLRFAMKDKSEWGKLLVTDEARWALEYYVKTIQENGAMYNTLNEPFGWEGRTFYESPAPSSAQWNVTSILALGYEYFKDKDIDFAKKCLEISIRSYNFLTGPLRPEGVYTHPDKYPMGMDPDFFYDQCRRGATSDIAYEISASCDLYRATKDDFYLERIKALLPSLTNSLDNGFLLLRKDDPLRTVSGSCSYTWLMSGILPLCDAYELLGDFDGLKDKIIHALEEICAYADKSVWRTLEIPYLETEMDVPVGHENKTRRECIRSIKKYGRYFYADTKVFEPSFACYLGIFLARGAKLVGNCRYMEYAQSVADNLLGVNNLDSSRIQGVGYNQRHHTAYGQFFPSTPFIPGAVGVGYDTVDVYAHHGSEFDMPCVGLSMYLLSEITEN